MRFGYVESEVRPALLMWGDGNDLRQLASLLRIFAAHPRDVSLSAAGFISPTGETVLIRPAREEGGIVRVEEASCFHWFLTPEHALDFAALTERLSHRSKGHQYLDGVRDVCTVMVSVNEYPYDFMP